MEMNTLLHRTNIWGGVVATCLTAIFGQYWFLFLGFLGANVIDWITGWAASKKEGKESSKTGARGIAKKVWYWIVILLAFYIGFAFGEMGDLLGVPLGFMDFVGWFVLANYLINELRSILENLVRLQVAVPAFLVKGLEITSDLVEQVAGTELEKKEEEK